MGGEVGSGEEFVEDGLHVFGLSGTVTGGVGVVLSVAAGDFAQPSTGTPHGCQAQGQVYVVGLAQVDIEAAGAFQPVAANHHGAGSDGFPANPGFEGEFGNFVPGFD